MLEIALGFLLAIVGTAVVTARWASARARRRMECLAAVLADVPSIASRTVPSPGSPAGVRTAADARVFFLEAYRGRRAAARRADARSLGSAVAIPTISLEHPRPARGA